MDENRSNATESGVIMDNKNILNIGSIFADINLQAAGRFIQDNITNQVKEDQSNAAAVKYEDREPIGDYSITYQELRHILDNIELKWGTDDTDSNLFNTFYQRDLLYLYDRITLDMNYLNGYPERNNEWLEKLLELKYEIRNMF